MLSLHIESTDSMISVYLVLIKGEHSSSSPSFLVPLWLHWTGKIDAGLAVKQQTGVLLSPLQLGISRWKFGHSFFCSSLYLENLCSNILFFNLNFKNALNRVWKDNMLMSVKKSIPLMWNKVKTALGSLGATVNLPLLLQYSGLYTGIPSLPSYFPITAYWKIWPGALRISWAMLIFQMKLSGAKSFSSSEIWRY